MKASRTVTTAGLLLFVYGVVRLFWWLDEHQPPAAYSVALSGLFKAACWVLPSAAALLWLTRRSGRGVWLAMGLDRRVLGGVAFGCLATLPLAFAVLASGRREASLDLLLGTALVGPFAEEVLFRGFLLTQLRERVGLALPWAIAISALAFGVAHAPQLHAHVESFHISSPWELALVRGGVLAGQVATLTAGGVVFAWVYWRVGSLWPAIALHVCLNFWLTVSIDQARIVPTWSVSVVAVGQLLSFAIAVWLSFGRPQPFFAPIARSS